MALNFEFQHEFGITLLGSRGPAQQHHTPWQITSQKSNQVQPRRNLVLRLSGFQRGSQAPADLLQNRHALYELCSFITVVPTLTGILVCNALRLPNLRNESLLGLPELPRLVGTALNGLKGSPSFGVLLRYPLSLGLCLCLSLRLRLGASRVTGIRGSLAITIVIVITRILRIFPPKADILQNIQIPKHKCTP